MKTISIMVSLMIATTALGAAQLTATDNFTKSPTEHIVNQIEQPFLVGSVSGVIIRKEGYREPLPNVLFEIEGPAPERRIRQGKTDEHGRFRIGRVPVGTYKFKATLNGFQSVTGTIIVSKR